MREKFGWVSCRDAVVLARTCHTWNRGRFSEILWEYGNLTPSILKERKARGWLYYEDGSQAGFALGRELRGWWHLEELWGPCEGSAELPTRTGSEDSLRARCFLKMVNQLGRRTLVRGAVDNPFANIIARQVGADWCGGFLLATRALD